MIQITAQMRVLVAIDLVWAQGRPVACLAFSSAPRHLGSRDRYIGWSAGAVPQHPLARLQHAFPDSPVGAGRTYGLAYPGPNGGANLRRLAAHVRTSDLLSGNVCGSGRIPRNLLQGGQLGVAGQDYGARQTIQQLCAEPVDQRSTRLSTELELSRLTQPAMKTKIPRRRIDVNAEELDRIIDDAKSAPLTEADSQKLKTASMPWPRDSCHSRKRRRLAPYSGMWRSPRPKTCDRKQTGQRGVAAMAPMPIAARIRSASRIRSWLTAIAAWTAPAATSIRRRNPKHRCGSWDRRRWPQRSMNWKAALQCLRAGVHGRGAGRCGAGEVR